MNGGVDPSLSLGMTGTLGMTTTFGTMPYVADACNPGALAEPARTAMQTAAPNLLYADVQSLEALLAWRIRPWTMGVTLFALFGVRALLAGRFVADLLFQTSPRNPVVFAAVAVLILLVAAAASFVPARRAARVDPVRALRGE